MRPSTGADEFWTWHLPAFIASFLSSQLHFGPNLLIYLSSSERMGADGVQDHDLRTTWTLPSRAELNFLLPKPYLWLKKPMDQCLMYILLMNMYRTTHHVYSFIQATLFRQWLFGKTRKGLRKRNAVSGMCFYPSQGRWEGFSGYLHFFSFVVLKLLLILAVVII